jgi:hypothetical protein
MKGNHQIFSKTSLKASVRAKIAEEENLALIMDA